MSTVVTELLRAERGCLSRSTPSQAPATESTQERGIYIYAASCRNFQRPFESLTHSRALSSCCPAASLSQASTRTDLQVHACCLMEELKLRGWEPGRLEELAKADPEKLKIAQPLRAQTCVSLRWIAQNLSMGTPAYLGNCLRIAKR